MAHTSPVLFPTRAPPTPPESPRKRRRLLRDSEDTEGYMKIEQYIYRSDPYCTTSMTVPFPRPLVEEVAQDLNEQLRPFHDEIQTTLQRHGFPTRDSFEIVKASKPGYPAGDKPFNLFRVYLLADDPTTPHIGPAKDDLLELLRRHNFLDVHVEIINLSLCHRPSLFFLSSTDPLVTAYEHEKHMIIDLLNLTLGTGWELLCPFNVGSHEDKAQPIIVVMVKPLASANWFELRAQIIAMISRYAGDVAVDVEFMPGNLRLLGPTGMSFQSRVGDQYAAPKMGWSVGIHRDDNAGTLGGYVTLTHDEKVRHGFLTNYHVVRPSKEKCPGSVLAALDISGVTFSSPPAWKIQMESLARMDRDATIADINGSLEAVLDTETEIHTRIQERELKGDAPRPNLQAMLEQLGSRRTELASEHKAAEKMPILLGEVTLASGMSVLNNRVMDWAFVELSKDAEEMCFRPNRMFPVREDLTPRKFDSSREALQPARFPLTDFGSLKEGL